MFTQGENMNKKMYLRGVSILLVLFIMSVITGCGTEEVSQTTPSTGEKTSEISTAENDQADNQMEDQTDIQESSEQENQVSQSQGDTSEISTGESFDIVPEPFSETYMFAASDSRELDENDIIGYDSILLQVGVNEIYARHGYTFKSDTWQTYFKAKDWYKPSSDFNEGMLSSIEKANIAFLQTTDPIFSTDFILVDMNQDGEMEVVETDGTTLYGRIDFGNGYEEDPWAESYTGSLVTDLDINDGELELLVFDSGPSADYTISVCTINEGLLFNSIATFPDQYFKYEIDGKGNASFETFYNMLYCLVDYVYEDGGLAMTQIHYPTFTLAVDTISFKAGDPVRLKITMPEDYDGENYLFEISDIDHADQVDAYSVPEDYTIFIDTLSSTFNEIDQMYYGD